MAIPVVAFAIYLAHVKPEPGILLVLAFDVVFAGMSRSTDTGHLLEESQYARGIGGGYYRSVLRLILFYTIPEHLAGLDTTDCSGCRPYCHGRRQSDDSREFSAKTPCDP